jgi:hypothetical protein
MKALPIREFVPVADEPPRVSGNFYRGVLIAAPISIVLWAILTSSPP